MHYQARARLTLRNGQLQRLAHPLAGADPELGMPLLSRTDLWAEKLMADADHGLDKVTVSRDN